ncbi:MAG: hypothetical protein DME26_21780 [Verrucomicrobia bacterium]|nr:MAG: hypothetical protein DME26_21780 [Verrucomicrobiota bacterium]
MKLPFLKRARTLAIPKCRVQTLSQTKMKTKTLNLGLVFIALTALMRASVHSTLAQGGVWTTKSPMTQPSLLAGAAVINGRMYVVGGNDGNGTTAAITEIYDPNTDAWSFGSPASIARAVMATGALNNKVYVAGGWQNSDANASTGALEIYDPVTDSWANGAPMSTPRGAMATAVIGGKLYAAGGYASYPYHAFHTLEIYDPLSNSWLTGAPMPNAVSFAGGAAINGKFYVAGGVSVNETPPTATLQIYDPVSDTWTTGAPMPTPNYGLAAGVIDGKMIVVSGDVSNVDIYDPILNFWAVGAPVPQPRLFMVAGVIGSQMFVTGGFTQSREISGALQVYMPDGSAATPAGENVSVSPGSWTTVTFTNVSTAGETAVTTTSSGPPPPAGFSLGDQPIYYDITTTALFTPPVTVCITYDPAQFIDPNNVSLLHYEIDTWVEVTPISNDTVAHVICGQVSSLSPFAVARRIFRFSGFLSPIGGADATGGSFANPLRTFKMNSTIPVKFTASSGASPVVTGVHTLQAIKYSNATTSGAPIDATPQDAATTGDQFRLVDGQWQFNLDTRATGMSVGIWLLRAMLSDGTQHSAWIQIK